MADNLPFPSGSPIDGAFEEVVLTAPAKLTTSLRVLGRRADGYHLIDAEMVTLDLADELRLRPAATSSVRVTGPAAGDTINPTDNLVTRALALIGVNAEVELVKHIPAGAGLGGGSADAAAVLRWAGWNDLAAAARLGADVPFCLVGGRARVRGIGERIDALPPRPGEVLTLLTPPVFCSTPAVYRRWDAMGGPLGEAGNDLEPAALEVAPELARWRDELAQASGQRPRLAGSGSTWFVSGAVEGPGRKIVRTV